MTTIKVNLKNSRNRSYTITADKGALNGLSSLIAKGKTSRYAIISDANVARLYGKNLLRISKKADIDARLLTFKAGESSKSLHTVETLLNDMVDLGFTRHDKVISLGGGVTGDIAGLVASIFMRGIPVIHVPTSLLAMVDSSIGGKTGVNLKAGKNLAGTFYQPEKVIIDPEVLETLPKKELANGFAEIIKYGVISDAKLFSLLEKEDKKILKLDQLLLNKIIIQCAKIKAQITQKDEVENGLRMILNYGHTAGHAIERYSQYKINHGRAISLGMVIANNIGVLSGLLNECQASRIKNLLKDYRLPMLPLEHFPDKASVRRLWDLMQRDKKMKNGRIKFIIPDRIGNTVIFDKVDKKLFLKSFSV